MKKSFKTIAAVLMFTSLAFMSCKKEDIKPTDTTGSTGTPTDTTTMVVEPDTTTGTNPVIDTTENDTGGDGGGDIIVETNGTPSATADNATTDRVSSVTVNVLTNDTDTDGDVLTVTGVTTPSSGTVVNNGNSLTFTPDSTVTGTVIFTYTVSDGTNTSNANVTVNVTKTSAEIETEALIVKFIDVDIYNVDGLSVTRDGKIITFDTTNKIVSVNFEQNEIEFTRSVGMSQPYEVNSKGHIVLPNITYKIVPNSETSIRFIAITENRLNTNFLVGIATR